MSDNTYDQQPDIRMPRTKAGIPAGGSKVYEAIVNQSGTSAPVMTILNNTIGDIIWTYFATGAYIGTLAGAFGTANTTCTSQGQDPDAKLMLAAQSNDVVLLSQVANNTTSVNNITQGYIKIHVFDQQTPTFPFNPTPPVGTKAYIAQLTQSGTDAPVATVMLNTLGEDVVWTYQSAGTYWGTCTKIIQATGTVTICNQLSAPKVIAVVS